MKTSLALVAFTGPNAPLAGVIGHLETSDGNQLLVDITNHDGFMQFDGVPMPFVGTLKLAGSAAYYEQPISVNAVNVTLRCGPSPANPQDIQLPAVSPFKRPAPVAPRAYRGQMCGIRIAGAPYVPGANGDRPDLILSWFYTRYDPTWRKAIRDAYKAAGYLDVLLSWTDDRDFGLSPQMHVQMCQELVADGLRPCEMLTSKYFCPANDAAGTLAVVNEVLPLLVKADCVSRYGVGFELNLWNGYDALQGIIDGIAAQVVPARPLYVHFSPGYADWRPDRPGSTFADFWNPQVGKLTGLWHQADPNWSDKDMHDRLADVLSRFAGNFNVSPDSGFGHPFDCVALEITAQPQYDGSMTEAQGNARADVALTTPAQVGPVGAVAVQGSGNGQSL